MSKTWAQSHSNQIYFFTYALATAASLFSFGLSWYLEVDPLAEDYSQNQSAKWFLYLTHLSLLSNLAQHTVDLALAAKAWDISPDDRTATVVENKKRTEPWRSSNITVTAMITALFWFMVYEKSQDGPVLPNAGVHGLPLAAYAITVVANNLDYAVNIKTSYLRAAAATLAYLAFNFAYVKLGGTNEVGQDFIYESLDWKEHLGRALMMSAGGLVAILPLQLALNRALNFLRSFPYPVLMTPKEGSSAAPAPGLADTASFWS